MSCIIAKNSLRSVDVGIIFNSSEQSLNVVNGNNCETIKMCKPRSVEYITISTLVALND